MLIPKDFFLAGCEKGQAKFPGGRREMVGTIDLSQKLSVSLSELGFQ
jgi:hypothetical protein